MGKRPVYLIELPNETKNLDAVAHGGNPRVKALPSQDRNGAFDLGEFNSPRVAPLHRCQKAVKRVWACPVV
ncbi:hypothetical protein [Moorena sp. SIO3H5]|uniref:hypothetical protein n=1 Tax=Moorena sp. SIO3H5 TaxID=2607834 RepID=UPI0013B663D3|nr:hypothetical protein [Moorena sp. SIO3H5]NEO69677.1 hypothetical protein [Moorena sp. SIO3H5]